MKPYKSHKILKIKILTFFILTITSQCVFSQIFSSGQNPPSVKFRQIKTENFQIIYPTLLEHDAQRVANTLEKVIADVSKSLGKKPQPISVILQGNTSESNGFVQTAPRRSEFYTMPSQEFDTQDWLNSLAVHELRHVVQFDKIAPHLGAPLFEELKLALFGINLPPWFFEGDAVVTETLLTPGGRGRQPSFDMVLRTNLLSGKNYSYSKNYLGSYKDFTPDYYTLGYFMTSKIRRDFGEDILDKILGRIASFPIRPYNFSSSLKKYGGYNTSQLYKNTMKETDSLWMNQSENSEWNAYAPLNNIDKKTPADYLLPYHLENGKILCLKSSKSETNRVIIIDNKTEKKIVDIGYQTEPNLHYTSGKIVWDEYRSDKRYGKQSFNVICLYDFSSGKVKQLNRKSRCFSPALSPDGEKVLIVNVSPTNKFNLEEIDAATGKSLKIYPNETGYVLQTPRYNEDGTKIAVTAVNQQGKTFLLYDTQTLKSEKLFEEERQLISRPLFWKNGIIYKSHYEGIDNIYFFDIGSKQKYKITSSRFGAFNPSVNAETNELLFNDYQSTGHNIVSLNLSTSEPFSIARPSHNAINYSEPLKSQENTDNALTDIPQNIYSSKPYKETGHLFYFHSLSPIVEDGSNDSKIGFNLVSDNKLNTLSTSIGYYYNTSLKANEYHAGITYRKFYPVFSVTYNDKEYLSYARLTRQGQTEYIPFSWREGKTSLTANIPFYTNWQNKSIRTGVEANTSYTNRYNLSLAVLGFRKTLEFPMQYQYYWSFATTRSARDLAPLWGLNLRLYYQHLPFDNKVDGDIFFLRTTAYLPGLFTNHGLQASFNWQNASGIFRYNTEIPRARGYANMPAIASLHNTFLFDYRFPIAYPDWEIGPLAYIKRLRSGLFTDFENSTLRSYGIGISADMNLLRFYLPNFAFDTRVIIPAEKNISKKPIFEIGITYDY